MVRGQGCLKTMPSHCLTSLRGSSRPVLATTCRGATHGGKAVCPSLVSCQGSPSGATSQFLVMTTGHGMAHGIALAWWGCSKVEELLVKGPRAVVPLTRREHRREGDLVSRLQGLASMSLRVDHDLYHNSWC
uniref:Uncharacterized protein n=1 Tax=Solanum tuberosum TaxID=4113 RepID=M1DAL6_SOLTU